MWDEPESRIKPELSSKERLLWSGRPRAGIVFRANDVFLIPFTLLWGGFAIFWEIMVIVSGAPFFFAIWGIPFVIVGLHLIFGRFFLDAWQREKTYYGVTNERVIIISGLWYQTINSVNIDKLGDLSLSEGRHGSGTITLGPMNPWLIWFGPSPWPGMQRHLSPTLEMIENARHVYETIRDIQRDSKRTAP